MKSIALTLGAIATLVAAQDISNLPECGQFCATDMLNGQAPGLGCSASDLACLCQSRDFTYGLRDCSAATCGPEEARRIVEFGIQICRDAGVEITTGSGGDNPTATGTEGGSSDDASGSVSTILSTISTDGTAIITPVATTTIGGGSDDSTDTEGESGTVTVTTPAGTVTSSVGDLVSTITSDGSTLVTTISTAASSGSETETDGDGGDSTATDGSASTTESDGAAMPQRTLAPAGIIAAGLAAFLL